MEIGPNSENPVMGKRLVSGRFFGNEEIDETAGIDEISSNAPEGNRKICVAE